MYQLLTTLISKIASRSNSIINTRHAELGYRYWQYKQRAHIRALFDERNQLRREMSQQSMNSILGKLNIMRYERALRDINSEVTDRIDIYERAERHVGS